MLATKPSEVLLENFTWKMNRAYTPVRMVPRLILSGVSSSGPSLRSLSSQPPFFGPIEIGGPSLPETCFICITAQWEPIGLVWNLLFSPEYGPINAFLRFVGIENPPGWTVSADWSMPAVLIVGTWLEMGYYMLLYLAGLQTIPTHLYEAAKVDGASAWQRFWHVTMPGLRHTTFLVTVLLTIGSFKVFDLILLLTQGGPGQSTLVLSQYIYMKGFEENQFGYASAVSIVLFVICFAITIVQYRVNRRGDA